MPRDILIANAEYGYTSYECVSHDWPIGARSPIYGSVVLEFETLRANVWECECGQAAEHMCE